jgi:hypothetical protein
MTILLLEIPPELYKRLSQEAQVMGDPVEIVAQRLLEEKLGIAAAPTEREQVLKILQASGLSTELGPEMRERALRSTASLDEIQAALDNTEGHPLSEIIIEMRGPKG